MVRDEPASNNDGANSFPNDNNNNFFFNLNKSNKCSWYKRCWNNGAIEIFGELLKCQKLIVKLILF